MSKKEVIAPQIVEFRKEDASKLAELFNSFDKEGLWPGGFTGGVPFTKERVLDSFPVKTKSIVVLISTVNGRFTGICSLHPHWEDEEAAYIGVLGVHPDFIGKGHGKALILESLRRAAENQLKRVDLHTWAGNLRAVPLYKKCGLYWVPETSVYMQDYVPAIIEFPFAKEFFKKHEWYSSQVRRLDLTPDDFKLGEMEVFPYEFASSKDYLKVWVDRYGRGILGLERTLQGEQFKVLAKLDEHKIISGVEHTLEIEILNNTKTSLTGSVFLSGFEGLNFISRPPQSFQIKKRDSLKLKAKFLINPETFVPHIERKQKSIKANLVINGKLIPLEIGMRIMPLLEFKTYPESIVVTPGTSGKVQFNVFNNSKKHLKGTIFLVDEKGKLNLNQNTISLDSAPESHTGFQVGIEISEEQLASAIPLKLSAQGKIGSSVVEAKSQVVYIKCLQSGDIVTWTEETEQGKEIFVENQEFLSHIRLREGLLYIIYKNALSGRQNVLNAARTEVGPPYGFTKPINFEYKIMRRSEGLDIVLWGMHPDKSELKIVETVRFYSGAPLIERKVQVVNMNPHVTHRLNARFSRTRSGRHQYRMIIPLDEILEHEMVGFPVSHTDLPTDPDAFKESWLCLQNKAEDYCFGQIWSKDRLVRIEISDSGDITPEYELGEVKPGQIASTPRIFYVLERGEWHNIRLRWRQLMDKKLYIEEEVVQARSLLNIETAKAVLLNRTKLKTDLKLNNRRSKAINGTISIEPPKGWKINPSKIDFKQITSKTPFKTDIMIHPPKSAKLGVHSGKIRLSTENRDYIFPMNLCILGDTSRPTIKIRQVKEQGKDSYKISNGFLNYRVSADFAGCLYFIGKDKINQLRTSFPTIKTHVFLENYSGGIRPVYLGERFDFQKSKTHTEKFNCNSFSENSWKGVKTSYEIKKQKELRGLQGSVSYLTLPQSNIIKIKRRFKNPTKASFDFTHYLWISPNIGGDFNKNTTIIPRDKRIIRCKRAEGAAVSFADRRKGWVLIRNEDKDQGLALIVGNTWKSSILSLDLGKTLLELFVMSRVQLKPNQTCEFEDYALLTNENFKTIDRLSSILRAR